MSGDIAAVKEISPGYALKAGDAPKRSGYKQTELGLIPHDWQAVRLDSIARVTSGKRLPAGYYVTENATPHPYIRVSDMFQGGVRTDSIRYVPQEAFPAISQYRIFKDDLFISVAGTLGLVGKIPVTLDGANLTENANRISDLKCNQDYLLYILLSDVTQSVITSIQTVGAQPKLALTRIRKFVIPLPPSEAEQRAIATALSDVDALLEELDRLIAKKRALKQATMQQLLTGQTRLPGFEGEWVSTTLGEIASFYKGKGLPKSAINSHGQNACVHYGELFTKYGSTISETISRTDEFADAFLSVSNDVLMPTSDVTPKGLAKASCITLDNVVLGGDILIIRSNPRALNGTFLSLVIRMDEDQVLRLVTGTTVYHLYGSDMQKFQFRMPEIDEQNAIVEVLSNIDAEIVALEDRRNKTALIKQAMMQELLTGRIRLI